MDGWFVALRRLALCAAGVLSVIASLALVYCLVTPGRIQSLPTAGMLLPTVMLVLPASTLLSIRLERGARKGFVAPAPAPTPIAGPLGRAA